MTTTQLPYRGGRDSAMSVAVGLGLLWQAAFSVSMLRHYVLHGSSFYLDNIAGAWPYVHQHLLWLGAFIAFGTGSRWLARVLAGGGALLAVVQIVSLASGGSQQSEVLTASGVTCFGVLPAIALLMPGVIAARHRRIDWVITGFLVSLVLLIFDDGIVQAASGGMSVRRSGLNGVLRAIWVGWVACILALALFRRGHRPSRLAALVSTGHLLVVQLVWLTSDVIVQPDIPGSLRALLSLDSVSRVLVLATILALLVLMPRPDAPSTSEKLLVERARLLPRSFGEEGVKDGGRGCVEESERIQRGAFSERFGRRHIVEPTLPAAGMTPEGCA